MSISIKDIAYKAKVSVATVSRVINKSSYVKEATRKRVLHVIDQLDYAPNLDARSLITGTTKVLAILMPPGHCFFEGFYYRGILSGICDTLLKHSYRLMIYQPEGYDAQFGFAPKLSGTSSAGLFLIAPLVNDRLVKLLEVKGTPAVLVSGRSPHLDWVDLNNVQASIEIVEKLVALGHRRIGFIGGSCRDHNSGARLEGYRQGLSKSGIPFDTDLVATGNYHMSGGIEATGHFLDMAHPPTAVYGVNDLTALGAIQAVRERGLSVPEHVSVFGFDDIDQAFLNKPTLSTARQDLYRMGNLACEMLISRVENPKAEQKTVELPGSLQIRQSVGPANHKEIQDRIGQKRD